MSKGIFITGTGTDVGKTYVTALLIKTLRLAGQTAAYYKAAVSGNIRDEQGILIPGDAAWVKEFSGIEQPLNSMVPYIYEQAVSPHLAARKEGAPIELSVVRQGYEKLHQDYKFITMEGSGGILCPLRYGTGEELWLEDVIKTLGLSCLVVANAGLGTINDTLLTLEYLEKSHIAAKGIILNHFHPDSEMEQDNCKVIEKRGNVPIIAHVQENAKTIDLLPEELMALYE